ncbi:MAG: sulfate ABC transporter ATP-binding protein [Verrucomicrobia bacterium 12-59-8]|nr:MAG: sulfate ABC transporter ATP-binding protein [Verrucomicrobia bacterium 12-59-8]
MSIHIHQISKTFGSFNALKNVDLEVKTGELVALLGPSGSGKTTLLRIIAGLEFADAGEGRIQFHGADVTNRSAYERKAGFVFQNYALFNHMTVAENIAFGLRVMPRSTRPDCEDIDKSVTELLRRIALEGYGDRYPSQLSGGQKQRVALARALAVGPQVLLLDEPFGALDAKVRKTLRKWLRQFHNETKVTTLFVTHDQDEAFELADRVVVLHEGDIQQIGSPQQLREHPKNEFVADFLDCVMI